MSKRTRLSVVKGLITRATKRLDELQEKFTAYVNEADLLVKETDKKVRTSRSEKENMENISPNRLVYLLLLKQAMLHHHEQSDIIVDKFCSEYDVHTVKEIKDDISSIIAFMEAKMKIKGLNKKKRHISDAIQTLIKKVADLECEQNDLEEIGEDLIKDLKEDGS